MNDNRLINMTIASANSIAAKSGFESYLDVRHEENSKWRHEILTCTKGKYSGETIDIIYDDRTGEVIEIIYDTQFKGQEPTFKFLSVS